MDFVIDPIAQPTVSVYGGSKFPVRRIFCIGRNYADHVREMGGDPKSSPPVFFTKPADAVAANGAAIPYAQATTNLHFEGELVVALKGGGKDFTAEDDVASLIYGYAAGCDLTRRDHQAKAKDGGAPWDTAKGFDFSAPVGDIVPADASNLSGARLQTYVNDEKRQDAALEQMIWSVPEILAALSRQFELKPGDLIFTGTPDGVGPVVPGDQIKVAIGDAMTLQFSIV
ncbi:fumarylacetoacetate hydrolase family protein [Hyphococcus flavus]|uniref:Fumarylacetoacetate hydrolase family protein n=1 Tax=Hyphococcus flavus TaxID=1866326 RepID=A0AAE9ZEB1_9PROT|nr:fumarylacetoacetate hydrolase family protein [Hyphococcus flavus]WDI31173.1 fumarylacetoacetate hydrolase family protein [Hyphococcus flavus]